jgi:hypothetical protein
LIEHWARLHAARQHNGRPQAVTTSSRSCAERGSRWLPSNDSIVGGHGWEVPFLFCISKILLPLARGEIQDVANDAERRVDHLVRLSFRQARHRSRAPGLCGECQFYTARRRIWAWMRLLLASPKTSLISIQGG